MSADAPPPATAPGDRRAAAAHLAAAQAAGPPRARRGRRRRRRLRLLLGRRRQLPAGVQPRHRAVRGLHHRHHGGAGRAADDRRRVRPVGRRHGDQLRADLLDVQLPDDGERLGRRRRVAAGHPRHRRLQRLHADPHQAAELHHHARHLPDADRPQPRLHQADQRHGLHQAIADMEGFARPARLFASQLDHRRRRRSRSPSCGGSALVARRHLDPAAHPRRQLDLRRRRRRRRGPRGRRPGRPHQDRPLHGRRLRAPGSPASTCCSRSTSCSPARASATS